MIARVHILLPYFFNLQRGAIFTIHSYENAGYIIRVFPPEESNIRNIDLEDEIIINSYQAYSANTVRIDFVKDIFVRNKDLIFDPPLPLIEEEANKFLNRLRYVMKSSQIAPININETTWRIHYLNDDETELEYSEQLARIKGIQKIPFSWNVIMPETWENLYSFRDGFTPPEWNDLLLDSQGALPNIGQAVVLAATALEVFIASQLDALATKKNISPELWVWINNHRLQEPSVEEQFGNLLSVLLDGHSLKDEQRLWNASKDIRQARNTFVHDGIALINKIAVTKEGADILVKQAIEIVNYIRELLPEELRWPIFVELNISLQTTSRKPLLIGASITESGIVETP